MINIENESRFNISQLAAVFGLDRTVIKRRLDRAGIEPVVDKPKEKIYVMTEDLHDALLNDGSNPELTAAWLAKIKAEAELKELELQIRKGEMLHVSEMTEIVQKIFGGLYRKTMIGFPAGISKRLHDADSPAELEKILHDGLDSIFAESAKNNPKYLSGPDESPSGKRQKR